ncbi:MAG: DUF2177 family protein [Cyclobacteriaceae bacterium]|nr:DUF2177 family protein [Cyclobacteriaceae bacterium]
MPIKKLLLSYALTAIVFFALDMLWLGLIAKKLYAKHLGSFLSDKINWSAAISFYLLFIAGIFVFVVLPAIERESWVRATCLGGLFGLIAYATYDLTNMATLKNWPLTIVIIDMLWGFVLTATVSVSGYFIVNWLNR